MVGVRAEGIRTDRAPPSQPQLFLKNYRRQKNEILDRLKLKLSRPVARLTIIILFFKRRGRAKGRKLMDEIRKVRESR